MAEAATESRTTRSADEGRRHGEGSGSEVAFDVFYVVVCEVDLCFCCFVRAFVLGVNDLRVSPKGFPPVWSIDCGRREAGDLEATPHSSSLSPKVRTCAHDRIRQKHYDRWVQGSRPSTSVASCRYLLRGGVVA